MENKSIDITSLLQGSFNNKDQSVDLVELLGDNLVEYPIFLLTRQQIIMVHNHLMQQLSLDKGNNSVNIELLDKIIKRYSRYTDDSAVSIKKSAAQLAFGILNEKPFSVANDITALHLMLIAIHINECPLEYPMADMLELIIKASKHRVNFQQFSDWIITH